MKDTIGFRAVRAGEVSRGSQEKAHQEKSREKAHLEGGEDRVRAVS